MNKKMILFAAVLQICLSTGSYAQKYCDLSIATATPADGAVIPFGDTAFVSFQIKNWGPDTLTATDTLSVYLNGYNFIDVAQQILPGATIVVPLLAAWNVDTEEDETLNACFDFEPYPNVSFIDTVAANDTSCSSFILKGSGPVSIKELKDKPMMLAIHPNPARDKVIITLPGKHTVLPDIRICDITGRTVKINEPGVWHSDREVAIDISKLQQGIYLLTMYDGEWTAYGKLVVR